MAESIFIGDGEEFTPTPHARGPWDAEALHGGAVAALISSQLERIEPGGELPFARLAFEFLRPVPMAPLKLVSGVSRPGRRVQGLYAELSAAGALVCRATALRIKASPSQLPEIALRELQRDRPAALLAPAQGRPVRFALDDVDRESFAASAIEMRFLQGGPPSAAAGEQAAPSLHEPTGAATVWMRLRHPLLPGQPVSSLARLAAAADFGNGVASVLPFERYLFINADLDITLQRAPRGEWIALDARTRLEPGGVGWAESVLHDELGPLGVARQALVVERR